MGFPVDRLEALLHFGIENLDALSFQSIRVNVNNIVKNGLLTDSKGPKPTPGEKNPYPVACHPGQCSVEILVDTVVAPAELASVRTVDKTHSVKTAKRKKTG